MPSLPDGEVDLHEVMEWAQEQAQFLTPTQTLVLWYLSINAFRTPNNRENREPGDVMSGRCPLVKIQHRTGLTDKTVRRTLQDLQAKGYIIALLRPGLGKSRITVFWSETFDEIRAEFRAGARDLPWQFKREAKAPPKESAVKESSAVVLQFDSGRRNRNTRS